VRFRNPLPFAMTSGPAIITTGGNLTGQTTSLFVNAGEQTSLPITIVQGFSLPSRLMSCSFDNACYSSNTSSSGRSGRSIENHNFWTLYLTLGQLQLLLDPLAARAPGFIKS
jgi:hypothetical protein